MTKHIDNNKAAIFAEEALVVDVQLLLHALMEEKGMSRADLARAMGVSRPRVTQMLSDECKNLTVRLLARAAHALGETLEVDCEFLRKRRSESVSKKASTRTQKHELRVVWSQDLDFGEDSSDTVQKDMDDRLAQYAIIAADKSAEYMKVAA